MRCADFGPTPGKQRRESISRASVGVYFIERLASKWKLHSGLQIHARHETGVLLLGARGNFSNRIIDGGRHQVLEHVLVLTQQFWLYQDLFYFVPSIHRHLDHARARFTGDLDLSQFGLSLLHVLLHLLRLAHQISQSTFHHRCLCCYIDGLSYALSTSAPKSSRSPFTSGSDSNVVAVQANLILSACTLCRAGEFRSESAVSKARR